MKKMHLVAYDLPDPSDKYVDLFEELRDFENWWHFIDGVWLLYTDESADSIYDKLEPHIDKKVNLLVIDVGDDSQGLLPKKAWKWIKKYEKNLSE